MRILLELIAKILIKFCDPTCSACNRHLCCHCFMYFEYPPPSHAKSEGLIYLNPLVLVPSNGNT